MSLLRHQLSRIPKSTVPRLAAHLRSGVLPRSNGYATVASAASRTSSIAGRSALLFATGAVAYTLGSLYPPTLLTFISPRTAPGPPDPAHPSSIAYTIELESKLESLPFLETLRAKEDNEEWYETRAYVNYPKEQAVNSLTAGALRGPGKLALPPLIRARRDEKEAYVVVHVGRGVCGHDGVVHGGLLATLFDESLARVAILNLPERIGVTATLSVNYKAPTMADQFVVLHIKHLENKGRKSTVEGKITDLKGTILAEANALFVQPKYAKMLNAGALQKAMGEPTHLKTGSKQSIAADATVTVDTTASSESPRSAADKP